MNVRDIIIPVSTVAAMHLEQKETSSGSQPSGLKMAHPLRQIYAS